MNYDNDELYLIIDFLEEQLEYQRNKESYTTEEFEQYETEEFFFIRTQEIIKSLIKE